MTPDQFRRWRRHMKLSQKAVADAFGLGPAIIQLYEAGKRPDKDAPGSKRPVKIPKTVELACAALALGIRSYNGPDR